MTTKDKTINSKKGELSSPLTSRKSFNVTKAFALREQLINDMAGYCAELSQVLLVDFAENVAIELLELKLDKPMFDAFKKMDRQITKRGLYVAGEEILKELRAMVA